MVKRERRADAQARGLAYLAKVGLRDRGDSYPSELSGGQQQRVAIARALAMEPEVLLFDEPTSALDPELVGEVLATMRNLAAEHRTMIIVTHEMTFARDAADRVIFMDGGSIVEQAAARTLFRNPAEERTRRYAPVTNLAEHYRWTLGRRTEAGVRILGSAITGAPVPDAYWLGGDEAMPRGDFLFAEIPAGAVPETVLEQLARLA